jgi:RimJ/RimL family protein N-acetyltransferase
MIIPVTDRLTLSGFRPADKPDCVGYLNDGDIFDRTLRIPHPYTESDFDQWLEIAAQAAAGHGEDVHFAIRDAGERLIGGIGFVELIQGHRAEIGYWLGKPYWGRGVMTAAVSAACQHAFARWHLVRITAHVFSFNTPSARVLEKNGFECEGLLRKHYLKNGQFLDARLYARVL